MSHCMQSRRLTIKKTDDEMQMAWAEVYIPLSVDTQADAMTSEEILKSMIAFAKNGYWDRVDINHSCQKSGALIVENFRARPGDLDFKEGSWVVGIWFPDCLWSEAKAGSYNGLSLYSEDFVEVPVTLPVRQAKKLSGRTEESTHDLFPAHSHALDLELIDGVVIPSFTAEEWGHSHIVKAVTATEIEQGHAHRLVY